VLVVLLTLETGFVNYHRSRGDWHDRQIDISRETVLRWPAETLPAAARARAEKARGHYSLANVWSAGGFGLITTPGLDLRLAWLDLIRGEPTAARLALETRARERGASDEIAADIGRILLIEGRVAEAEAHYVSTLRDYPDFATVRDELGRLYVGTRRAEKGLLLYRSALDADPTNAPLRARLASILLSMGQTEAAVLELRRAVNDAPTDGAVRHDLAVALYMHGEVDTALLEMAHAVTLSPHDRSLQRRLEEMRREAGRLPPAEP
jgi:Flp pilus assembly protein TadD